MADVFSSETGAAGAPSRPLPQAEATVSTENTSPLTRSLKKAGVGEPEHIRQGGCGERKRGSGRAGAHTTRRVWERGRGCGRAGAHTTRRVWERESAGVGERAVFPIRQTWRMLRCRWSRECLHSMQAQWTKSQAPAVFRNEQR